MSVVPLEQLDGSELLNEAERDGNPIAVEAARRYFEAEPNVQVLDELLDRAIPCDSREALQDWLDKAIDREDAAVGDREHLVALLSLLDAGNTAGIETYLEDTVRPWVR